MQRDVGRRIRELRAGLGLTQQALADRIGVTVQYAQRVEGGSVNLTLASLLKFADALECDPRSLLDPPTGSSTSMGDR